MKSLPAPITRAGPVPDLGSPPLPHPSEQAQPGAPSEQQPEEKDPKPRNKNEEGKKPEKVVTSWFFYAKAQKREGEPAGVATNRAVARVAAKQQSAAE